MEAYSILEQRSRDRLAFVAAAAGLALIVAGFAGADTRFARADFAAAVRVLDGIVRLLDIVTGKEIANLLLPAAILAVGLAASAFRNRRFQPPPWLYVGAVQLLCTLVADLSKPPFGRLRPFQALAQEQGLDRWFMGAEFGSFPSGHVAFYAGLCLPLAMLIPRWALPLLSLPLLVGAERILSHDHYLSDVGGSFLLCGVIAGGLWKAIRPGASIGAMGRARAWRQELGEKANA